MQSYLHANTDEEYTGTPLEVIVRTTSNSGAITFRLSLGADDFTFFVSRAQLDLIYGTINNYLESQRANA